MKLHKVYTSSKAESIKTRVGIPTLALVMYRKFNDPVKNRLRRFYSDVRELDVRVTKYDFT